MYVNKILLKTGFKHNAFLNFMYTMTMGQHILVIFGALAVDKPRKE